MPILSPITVALVFMRILCYYVHNFIRKLPLLLPEWLLLWMKIT